MLTAGGARRSSRLLKNLALEAHHARCRQGLRRRGSQRIRKRIEEVFGWTKSAAGQRQTRFRGFDRVGWAFSLTAAAYNLVRLPKLLPFAAL
jgi:hypothetical protein